MHGDQGPNQADLHVFRDNADLKNKLETTFLQTVCFRS